MSCNIERKDLLGDVSSATLSGLNAYIDNLKTQGFQPSIVAKAGGVADRIKMLIR